MKDLLEAGVHFGHHTRKWNPKMKPFIYGARNDIYIIDLHKTRKELEKTYESVRQLAFQGKKFLFVGTKKQAQDPIKESAEACEQFYVNHRWLGGMMTNWNTVQLRIDRLNQIDRMIEDGTLAKLVKKEQGRVMEERTKLDNTLGGIRTMNGLPDVLFIIDCRKEQIAINEARKLEIPIVAVVDTNCDPDEIDYVIPGNDDAIRAVQLMASQMAEAINEGRTMRQSVMEERSSQLGQAAGVSFGGGQIDFAGAADVQFAPVASDEEDDVFDSEMAKNFDVSSRAKAGLSDPESVDAEVSTRAAGGQNVLSEDVTLAHDLDASGDSMNVQTTTGQSFARNNGGGADVAVDNRQDSGNLEPSDDGDNRGGAADQEVNRALKNA
jgi:small subunit ribosomal protein S2